MIRYFKSFMLVTAMAFSTSIFAVDKPNAEAGKKLFQQSCQSCHGLDNKVVGPALRGVTDRRSEEWLIKWVRNNKKLIASGDKDAVKVFNENAQGEMSIFEYLTPDDVKNILEFIKTAPPPVTETPVKPGDPVAADNSTLYILLTLVGVFFIVLLILNKVKHTLRRLAAEKMPEDYPMDMEPKHWYLRMLPKGLQKMNLVVLSLFTTAIVGVIAFVFLYDFGMKEIGVQKGYAPAQPIAFSHKIHAGDLKLNCRYCHSTVEYSKQASIPSLNTCMNCHKGVQKGSKSTEPGPISKEIQKIYTALDYNPEKSGEDAFGPNPKPIRWVRVHNLPDLAYFNHSQHVKVGNLACQDCHGPVESMDVVQQWSSLQMGWCIDCHRNTGIQSESNNYYKDLHAKATADIAKNGANSKYFTPDGRVKITVAKNGGLECSKCHY